MKIPPQPTAIALSRPPIFAALLLAACNAPDRATQVPAPSPPVHVNVNVTVPPSASSPPTPSSLPPSALPEADAAPPSAHHYAIAAIGDSLTDRRSHGGGYLEYVRARCPGIEIDNFAKGGIMVNQMRSRFDEQVATSGKHYTHLVVFGGVNDLYSDLTAFRTPAKIEADLGYMYDWAHAHDVKVVALTVAPWGGYRRFNESRAAATHEVNAWIRGQPSQGHVDQVVDAYALLSCGDPDSLCERFFAPFKDGVHFGPEGHELLGQALFQSAFSDCE